MHMTRRRPIAILLLLLLLGLFGAQTHHSAEGHLHVDVGPEATCEFCQHVDNALDAVSIALIDCYAVPLTLFWRHRASMSARPFISSTLLVARPGPDLSPFCICFIFRSAGVL